MHVVRIDDLDIEPDVVKIDVEGWEPQVLEGMQNLLQGHRPALIIELNDRESWAPELESLGYRFHGVEGGCLVEHGHWQAVPGLNVVCLHPRSRSAPAQLLWRSVVRPAADPTAPQVDPGPPQTV